MNAEKKRTVKRKIFIVSRYIKYYSSWAVLLTVLLLSAKIIHRNYINTSMTTVQKRPIEMIQSIKPEIVLQDVKPTTSTINTKTILTLEKGSNTFPVEQTLDRDKLAKLEKQLLEEKEKNKNLAHSLNNQEQQLISALNNISESYNLEIKNNTKSKKVTSSKNTNLTQSDYYIKVRSVLNKQNSYTQGDNSRRDASIINTDNINLTNNEG